ncbi:MAG: hypothetical protein CM15mP103_09030 [Gammaproteobacteria bacterium]|nr:MAG: hypothetical protein CM15mP103_09030 [Gammaproteobacteria bacterium]
MWRVVDKKWPQFEEVFWEFDVERLLMMPDDMLERKARDPAIIRNFSKVKNRARERHDDRRHRAAREENVWRVHRRLAQ